jgi:hypothetical protein
LSLLLLNLPLLLFHGSNQDRGKPAVIHALRVFAVRLKGDDFGHDLPDFLGDHANLVLAATLQVVGNSAQLFDFRQRIGNCLNVALPPPRTVSRSPVSESRTKALANSKDVRRKRHADADVTRFLYHETARCGSERIDAEVSEASERGRGLAAGWARRTLDPKAIASDADMQLERWRSNADADARVGGSAVYPVDTLVVSTFSVTPPPVPPPVRPVPAVIPVMVPVPGNVCPAANVTSPVKLPVPCTSSFAAGAVVPIPTNVSAFAPFTPLMLSSTSELLCVTVAKAPMAVTLLRAVCVPGLELTPTKVL